MRHRGISRVHWKWLAVPAAVALIAGGTVLATAGPAFAGTCTVTAGNGGCGPYTDSGLVGSDGQNTFVNNNMWAANSGTTQTLTASSPENWTVRANAGPAGYTGVQTYPDVQQLLNGWDGSGWNSGGANDSSTPVHSLASLTSSFNETMPDTSQTDSEAGYDIWVGNAPSNDYSSEIMVWNQNVNRGPGGGATELAAPTLDGVGYTLYRNGGPGGELIFEMNSGESSGTVNLLAPLNWLIANGYEEPDMALAEIDYGWEICSTGAQDETFTMNDYSLSATRGGTSAIAPVAYASAADVTSTGATLNGTVNPDGRDTTYQFEYGTTNSFGSSSPVSPAGAGPGTAAETETATLTGLTPGTVYHYRIEATNAAGTTHGQDQTFTTPAGAGTVLDDKTFEDGTRDDLDNWYGETSHVTTSQAHLGTHSLEIEATSSNWAVSDAWPGQAQVTPGQMVLFTGWLKSAAGSADLTVTIKWLGSDGNMVGSAETIKATDDPSRWTEFTGQFTPPAGATSAYEELGSVDGGAHYLDDLAVTQVGAGLDLPPVEHGAAGNLAAWYTETTQQTAGQSTTP